MGMFDTVNYESICPVCHAKVDDFQTKDTDCLCETVEPQATSNFYSNCDTCGCWIEFTRNDKGIFVRTVEGKNKIMPEHTKEIRI